ncbi:hypothetical protein HW561_20780 [Rhodobacteraceae bacterium B1Z28]|uniref:Uncharacterized protein n=1 Tax=Ruegeria haliotis TaxID=2747601 RepID=A0ABX2PVK9_9RHOB|nr:hypothetical protein [Ruegeria haliotis]NVO58228.1 hypothetical protein [Ruegeria haliotis]
MSPEIGQPVAHAYEAGYHDPHDPLVLASYQQLIGEMFCQYRFVTETLNMHIEPYFGEGEPYEDSAAMRVDVSDNGHLYFLTTTEEAFGSGQTNVTGNWMGQSTGVQVDGYELLVNDMFRAVHDFFGHAVPGTSFSATGEERAWYCHSRMCSPLARSALTTETRGQNTWVNFGPHMLDDAGNVRGESDSGWLAPRDRPFAEQKNMILPASISGVHLFLDQTGVVKATAHIPALAQPEFA